MTFDPITNQIPFGLLTNEQQAALSSWPHGWECFASSCGWSNRDHPMWSGHLAYRGKPAPVVTSVWFNCYNHSMTGPHVRRAQADRYEAKGRKKGDLPSYLVMRRVPRR